MKRLLLTAGLAAMPILGVANPSPPNTESPRTNVAQPQTTRTVTVSSLIRYVSNRKSSFAFDATIDRFDGGKYACGDPIKVNAVCEKPGFLYLFITPPDSEPQLLFPLPGEANIIATNAPITIGGRSYRLSGKPGTYHIHAIVTEKPLIIASDQMGKKSKTGIAIERLSEIKPETLGLFAQDEVVFQVVATSSKK